MNKSLQPVLRQGFHGISNKLPNKNSACLENMQTKAPLQDQTKYLSSLHRTEDKNKENSTQIILFKALQFLIKLDTCLSC